MSEIQGTQTTSPLPDHDNLIQSGNGIMSDVEAGSPQSQQKRSYSGVSNDAGVLDALSPTCSETKLTSKIAVTRGVVDEAGKPSTHFGAIWRLGVAVMCGYVFGTVINKSNVNQATVLRNQFDFSGTNVMLKIFLVATGTSIFTIALMHLAKDGDLRKLVLKSESAYRGVIGVPATMLGGALLGIGMTVAGACPGTVWVQLGSGSLKSLITVAGGITAAIVHGVVAHRIQPWVEAKPIPSQHASMADRVSTKYRTVLGVLVACALYLMVVGLNAWRPSPQQFFPSRTPFTQPTWNPAFAGIFIGVLQYPLTKALAKNVGSASTMQTLASVLFMGTNKFPQMNKMKWGLHRWWQVTYLMAAMGASAVASYLSVDGWYNGDDITVAEAFIGGFLIIFGSRIAGGCTSGHGISGAGHLMWRSWLAIAAMFAGAIAARFALYTVIT